MAKTTPTCWELLDRVIAAKAPRVLLFGPPGVGKSYTPFEIAKANGWEFLSITLTDQTPASRLEGHFVLKGSEFVWHDGIFTRAWRISHERPVVVEINELNEASVDAEVALHNYLDDPEFARVDLPNHETVRPKAGNVLVVATMNTPPDVLGSALRDRFPIQLRCDFPHPAAIAKLPGDLQNLAKVAAMKSGDDRISLRAMVAFAAMREAMKPELAAQAIFGDKGPAILTSIAVAKG